MTRPACKHERKGKKKMGNKFYIFAFIWCLFFLIFASMSWYIFGFSVIYLTGILVQGIGCVVFGILLLFRMVLK